MVLFRVSTGEDWHLIMFDTTRNVQDGCISTSCGAYAYVLFFIAFIIVVQYIMLNLYVLILMDTFQVLICILGQLYE